MKLLFTILFLSTLFVPMPAQTAQGHIDSYEKWIEPYRAGLAAGGMRRKGPEMIVPLVVITEITDGESNAQPTVFFPGPFTRGYFVNLDGAVESFARRTLGYRSGCCSPMSDGDILRAKEILAEIPSDSQYLPPNKRRLLVQHLKNGSIEARVYDLAFLPDSVTELLRLTKAGIRSYVPSLTPETTVAAPGDMKAFAISPDGRLAVSSRGSTAFWATRDLAMREVSQPFEEVSVSQNVFFQNGLTLSSDGRTAIAGGWGHVVFYDTSDWRVVNHIQVPPVGTQSPGFSKSRFIERGKYLLFETGFGLRVVESTGWREVPKPSYIPDDAVSYYESADSQRQIFQIGKKVILRNGKLRDTLLTLAEDKVENASFSPDGTRVVIVTSGILRSGDSTRRHVRMRLWDTKDAKVGFELRPFEQDRCEAVYGIEWTSDGKHIVAATKSDTLLSNGNIGIWDARSGRHVGELEGCVGTVFGMRLMSDQTKVAAGCSDGKIRIWDLRASLDEIAKLSQNRER